MEKPSHNSILDKTWGRLLVVLLPMLLTVSSQFIHDSDIRILTFITFLGVIVFSIIHLHHHDNMVIKKDAEYKIFLSKIETPEMKRVRQKRLEDFYDNQ